MGRPQAAPKPHSSSPSSDPGELLGVFGDQGVLGRAGQGTGQDRGQGDLTGAIALRLF